MEIKRGMYCMFENYWGCSCFWNFSNLGFSWASFQTCCEDLSPSPLDIRCKGRFSRFSQKIITGALVLYLYPSTPPTIPPKKYLIQCNKFSKKKNNKKKTPVQ